MDLVRFKLGNSIYKQLDLITSLRFFYGWNISGKAQKPKNFEKFLWV